MNTETKVQEIFKDIPDYKGLYQVSNLGNVKSLERRVRCINGFRTLKGRALIHTIGSKGYYRVGLSKNSKCKTRRVHQLVAESFLNHKPVGYKLVVNHIDFDKLNNKVENLEIVTQRENSNQKHLKSSSKYIGVSWKKRENKWRAQININNKRKHLGYFDNELEAADAYKIALDEHNSKRPIE